LKYIKTKNSSLYLCLIYFVLESPSKKRLHFFIAFLFAYKNSYFAYVSNLRKNIHIGIFISAVNFLIQCATFFINNFMARNLGAIHFGYLGILQSDYLIFCALADFGTATLILAFFGQRASRGRLLAQVFQLRFLLAFAAMLLMCLFAFTIRRHHPAFYGELILAIGLIFQHAFFDWYFLCGKFWKRFLASKILHTISYTCIMSFALLYLQLQRIEFIALAMVLAALPAWGFGVRSAFSKRIFMFTKRSLLFVKLILNKAFPFALASLASFAYLPVGLYAADIFAPPDFLGAYNFSHKLIVLASGFMVYFISSTLISQHESRESQLHTREILFFTLFITLVCSPLLLFPKFILHLFFFAVLWTDSLLDTSAFCLQLLTLSLIFQAARMSMISSLLKQKKIWTYVAIVSGCGMLNIVILFGMLSQTDNFRLIPLWTLSGDLCITLFLFGFFLSKRRLVW